MWSHSVNQWCKSRISDHKVIKINSYNNTEKKVQSYIKHRPFGKMNKLLINTDVRLKKKIINAEKYNSITLWWNREFSRNNEL